MTIFHQDDLCPWRTVVETRRFGSLLAKIGLAMSVSVWGEVAYHCMKSTYELKCRTILKVVFILNNMHTFE